MNPKNHQPANEDQFAEDLDTFLSAQLEGQIAPVPTSLARDEANLAIALTNLTKVVQPDATFACDLEARLLQVKDSYEVVVKRDFCNKSIVGMMLESNFKEGNQQQSYDIAIAPGSLDQLGQSMTSLNLGKKVLVVSNPAILRHYGEHAIASLSNAGFEVATLTLPAGESYKTLTSVEEIYNAALENQLERSSTLVALGGGVIGDMTGFAAATWLRGINFVQVPTTLLAMVDAAIGGKTGVNHPKGKNLIGAFHQPRLVLIDPQVLNTLPEREFRAGMAEVIKYGVIWDAELFAQMEKCDRLDQLGYVDEGLLQEILTRSAQAKADVVSKDEKEAGLRVILNYGHTIGHAVESLTGYSLVNHGEAVALGMVAAGMLAVDLQFWEQAAQERQGVLIQKVGLPTQLPAGIDIEAIIDALQTDKKVKAGRVRFVLPTQIGAVTVTDQVQPQQIRQVLWQMQS